MAKYTSKQAIILIISFLFTQSCQKQPNNIDVSSGYESIVNKLEDAIPVSYTHLTLPTNREV